MIGFVKFFNPKQKTLILRSGTKKNLMFQFEIQDMPSALENYYITNLKQDRLIVVRFKIEQDNKLKNTRMIVTNISFPLGETQLSF